MTEEVELIDYLRVIWKWKWLIILGTSAFILAAGVISWLQPPSYQAKLILKIGQVTTVNENGEFQEIMIDDPNSVQETVMSKPLLFSIIEENQLKLESRALIAKAEVVRREWREREANLIRFSIRAGSPEEVISLINSIAEEVIDQHRKKFDEAMKINFLLQEELEKQIAGIEEEIREVKSTLSKIEGRSGDDVSVKIMLQADLAEKERTLSELRGKYRRVQLANSPIGSENTKILTPAIKPGRPVSPKKLLNITLAAMVGLMATVILAFFLEYLQKVKGEGKQ
jgi:capsular polysaccharide biosynthesis protein